MGGNNQINMRKITVNVEYSTVVLFSVWAMGQQITEDDRTLFLIQYTYIYFTTIALSIRGKEWAFIKCLYISIIYNDF